MFSWEHFLVERKTVQRYFWESEESQEVKVDLMKNVDYIK